MNVFRSETWRCIIEEVDLVHGKAIEEHAISADKIARVQQLNQLVLELAQNLAQITLTWILRDMHIILV